MSKLINYKSKEGQLLKQVFQDDSIDPYIALIVESYIYKEMEEKDINNYIEKYMTKYGKKEGKSQTFYKSGNLYREFYYKEEKIEGLSYAWYEEGSKMCEFNYKDGKLEGECKSWHLNGEIHRLSKNKEGYL